MKLVLIMCTLSTLLFAIEDLDDLLTAYKDASELSKKTKDENVGHLIVYTRDDLERMQVETLKDILKSIRVFRYFENRVNEPDILNIDPIVYNSKSIRIYLNETELLLPITGSGFPIFGNIDMDFIDHVEIYEGFPSFEFAIEAATIVIKLYSKTAKKDTGSRIKILTGSNSSIKANVYTTGFNEDIAYFIYANTTQNRQNKYLLDGKNVGRDITTKHFYASFKQNNYTLELNALNSKHDAFLGILPYQVPKTAQMEKKFLNISLNSKFDDKTLSFKLSYIYADGNDQTSYATPLLQKFGGFSKKEQRYTSSVVTAILKKNLTLQNNVLSFGIQYRYKKFNFTNITQDSIPIPTTQVYNHEAIYSFFLEDSYKISSKSLLGFSFMQQYYKRNLQMKDELTPQLRLSYIYTTNNWLFKTFVSRQTFTPEPFMTATEYIGNPDLNPEVYYSLTHEMNYKTDKTLSKIIVGYGRIQNILQPDTKGKIHNSQDEWNIYYTSLECNYFINSTDKLEFQIDHTHMQNIDSAINSIDYYNSLFRMLHTIGNFDIFNELVVNYGYQNVTTGFDYSAGVKYAFNKDLHINLKGENIFNKGLQKKYYYNISPRPKQLSVPVIEQKFLLSLEYLF